MTANEWGDFLAGVFAPVAFLWLIATVWIQSDELREQRKELQLTRREFELNRAVMMEQANEAKRQAEFLESQTSLLRDEAASRRGQENLTSFTILMSRYVEHSREVSSHIYYKIGRLTGLLYAREAGIISQERFIQVQDEWLSQLPDFTDSGIQVIGFQEFVQAYKFLYAAEELLPSIPFHSRVSWEGSKISILLARYGEIISHDKQLEHMRDHVSARKRRLGLGAVFAG